LGILLYDDDNQVQWVNPYFVEKTGIESAFSMSLSDISNDLLSLVSDDQENESHQTIKIGDKYYLVQIQRELQTMYFMDITRYSKIERRYEDNRSVIGQVYLDN